MRSNCPPSQRPKLIALAAVAVAAAVVLAGCRDAGRGSGGAGGSGAGVPATPVLVPLTNMVPIRAGSFMRVKFPVTLTRDFWIGRYEVTQGEFLAVMGKNPSHFTGDPARPVEKVSFIDASNYCAVVTQRERVAGRLPADHEYRLPYEAEWEFACRAGSTNLFNFGDDVALADDYAWTGENSDGQTHPVGQKRPNAWGLYDTHGNVWEWCLDWFAPYPAMALVDPVGPATNKFKLFKGGGWDNDAPFARASSRFMMPPVSGIHFVGFRMALAPIPARSAKP
jgi:formylglycine-generating enzyme required for sulfatase activity